MYTTDLRVYAVPGVGNVKVRINGSHITITGVGDGKVIYCRDAFHGTPWYDDSHKRIVSGIEQLTNAIIEATKCEGKAPTGR